MPPKMRIMPRGPRLRACQLAAAKAINGNLLKCTSTFLNFGLGHPLNKPPACFHNIQSQAQGPSLKLEADSRCSSSQGLMAISCGGTRNPSVCKQQQQHRRPGQSVTL